MTEEQHKWLFLTVRDLDAVLPNPEAAVQITSEEETCTFTATQEGYLRLGVEMLKAATVTPGEKDEEGALRLDFDLSRLMAPDNEVEVDSFLMVDSINSLPEADPYPLPPPHPWRERLASFGAFAFVLYMFSALIVGTAVIVTFLLRLLL